jgi:hypothetical protein
MMIRDADERRDYISALTLRYVLGELSEEVYTASLSRCCEPSEIRHLVLMNQTAYKNSTNFKRGLYR